MSVIDYLQYLNQGRKLLSRLQDLLMDPPSNVEEYAALQREVEELWDEIRKTANTPGFDAAALKTQREADLAVFTRRADASLDAPQDAPPPPPPPTAFPYNMRLTGFHPRTRNDAHLLKPGDVIWRLGGQAAWVVRSASDPLRHSAPDSDPAWREDQTI